MDVIYRRGRATAAEVREGLTDAPSYSAVRAHLRTLEDKGHLRHEQEGPRYVYHPTTPRTQATESALRRVLNTFFDDSTEKAVAALLDMGSKDLGDEELARLSAMIEQARREGR